MFESLLITGANGFVGQSVLDQIVLLPEVQRPRVITVATRREFPEVNWFISQGLNINSVIADLTEPWKFDRDFSHVIQLAADGSSNAYSDVSSRNFVKISERLVQWCQLSKNAIEVFHASSGACFGYQALDKGRSSPIEWNKENFVNGRLRAEGMLKDAQDDGDLNLRIGRLYSFLGRHIATKTQYAASSFLIMAKRDGVVRITGSPATVRSYLDASDMADWILKSLIHTNCENPLSIGSSTEVTILELAHEIARLIGVEVKIESNLIQPDRYVANNEETMVTLGVRETKTWKESVLEFVENS
jgi:nucleoside-diphosphate-sugar epimerase